LTIIEAKPSPQIQRRTRPTLTALIVVFCIAGCAYHTPLASSSYVTTMPTSWFLVEAPFTREFPGGKMAEPVSKWLRVTTFDTSAQCDAALIEAQNELQRPVQCIASDDPRMTSNEAN
jgi:hypothetical protein